MAASSAGYGHGNLQATACERCRKQKLKCTREEPRCKRCLTAGTVCSYPHPPDRKRLAALRAKSRLQRGIHGSDAAPVLQRPDWQSLPEAHSWTGASNSSATEENRPLETGHPAFRSHSLDLLQPRQDPIGGPYVNHEERASSPGLPNETGGKLNPWYQREPQLPSNEVAVFLIEVYFSRLYNASLLFHKPRFQSDYAAGRVPDFLLMSVFALATIFVKETSNEPSSSIGIESFHILDWQTHGLEWASLASRKALSQADIPNFEVIRACQNLALYWFSTGQTDRTNFHSNVAYRTCRLLSLHNESAHKPTDPISAETRRRCVWSCWMTSCISQGNANFRDKSWSDVLGLPLPSDEDSFLTGEPLSIECFNQKGDVQPFDRQKKLSSPGSYYAELAKLLCLWWETQNFANKFSIKKNSSQDSSQLLPSFFDLDFRLERFYNDLPPNLRFDDLAPSASRTNKDNLFAIGCLYHVCICVLHASLIPRFSSTSETSMIPQKLVRASAEQATSHSALVMEKAKIYLESQPDLSRLWSVSGFCMYVCISIQLASLEIDPQTPAGNERLRPALSILNTLARYWRPLENLLEKLESLFASSREEAQSKVREQRSVRVSGAETRRTFTHVNSAGQNATTSSRLPNVFTYVSDEDSKTPDDRSSIRSPGLYRNRSHLQSESGISSPQQPQANVREAEPPGLPEPSLEITPVNSNAMVAPVDESFFENITGNIWWDQNFDENGNGLATWLDFSAGLFSID